MLLSDFQPRPTLVTKTTEILQPRFLVIDAHNHLGEPFAGGWDKRPQPGPLAYLRAIFTR